MKENRVWRFYKNGNPSHRRCSNCKEFKTLSHYATNKSTKQGIQNTCKECMYHLVTADTRQLTKAQIRKYVEEIMPYEVDSNGCWIFGGTKNKAGYGRCTVNYVVARPHRLALMYKLGRHLLDNLEASHLCHNAQCVNPDHLVEETHMQNMERGRLHRQALLLGLEPEVVAVVVEKPAVVEEPVMKEAA